MAQDAKSLAKAEIENISSVEEDFEHELEESDDDKNVELYEDENRDDLKTHKKVRSTLSGNIIHMEKGHAKTTLQTTKEMSVDDLGLIHSGFIFGAAEYAAVVSINEENLVIIGAKSKFLAPAKNGDLIEFEAIAKFEDARKREIKVTGSINEIKIFDGIFQAIILEKHILKTKLKNITKDYHTVKGTIPQ